MTPSIFSATIDRRETGASILLRDRQTRRFALATGYIAQPEDTIMFRRLGSYAWVAALTLGLCVTFADKAWAGLTATAACDAATGGFVISYNAHTTRGTNTNSQVNILFNNVVVGTGAVVAPTYGFTGSAPAPAGAGPGDSVVVTWLAVATWSDGVAGGQSRSVSVTLPAEPCGAQTGLGRFTGGGSQIKIGPLRVTRGLTIHCDLLLSNNLEINWNGNQFHMLEHLTTVSCTDDPDIGQAPPPAPLDTLVGVGAGRYNGNAGYTVEFTLVDYGEPGSNDQMSILIYETANPANVVLSVPLQVLTGGNLQAHYDQPHK